VQRPAPGVIGTARYVARWHADVPGVPSPRLLIGAVAVLFGSIEVWKAKRGFEAHARAS